MSADRTTLTKSPIIDGEEVTYIYYGQAETVYVAGDYNRWELKDKMKMQKGGDLWYKKKKFPTNSRFDINASLLRGLTFRRLNDTG